MAGIHSFGYLLIELPAIVFKRVIKMDKEYVTWLGSLKVGDRVIVKSEGVYGDRVVSKVTKITPTGLHRVEGVTGLFRNGVVPSKNWGGSYSLLEPTAERIDAINLIKMRTFLKNVVWDKIDDDVVRRIWKMVK